MKFGFIVMIVVLMFVFAVPALAAPAAPVAPDPFAYDPIAEYYAGDMITASYWQTGTVTIGEATTALSDIGVLPVITIGALIFVAGVLYKRFRR